MNTNETLDKTSGLTNLQFTDVDEDMLALISSLIDQNAELMQKIQEINSQKKDEDEVMVEVEQKATLLGILAEQEVNRRAADIINQAGEKARVEADKILAEATRQAEAVMVIKEKQANDRAESIINEAETKAKIEGENILAKAKMEADRVLTEAKQKGEKIIEEKNQFAIQQGLRIINKAEERALIIIREVESQTQAINGRAKQKSRG
ncbi:MAG TPA: hypothetical protein VEG28_04415 [Dehalococcoidia bacterium]|nr:hypothetical protein [Dehalococcoidia bacterium]